MIDGGSSILAPNASNLFDDGWTTFIVKGRILAASSEAKQVLRQRGINTSMSLGRFTEK